MQVVNLFLVFIFKAVFCVFFFLKDRANGVNLNFRPQMVQRTLLQQSGGVSSGLSSAGPKGYVKGVRHLSQPQRPSLSIKGMTSA